MAKALTTKERIRLSVSGDRITSEKGAQLEACFDLRESLTQGKSQEYKRAEDLLEVETDDEMKALLQAKLKKMDEASSKPIEDVIDEAKMIGVPLQKVLAFGFMSFIHYTLSSAEARAKKEREKAEAGTPEPATSEVEGAEPTEEELADMEEREFEDEILGDENHRD